MYYHYHDNSEESYIILVVDSLKGPGLYQCDEFVEIFGVCFRIFEGMLAAAVADVLRCRNIVVFGLFPRRFIVDAGVFQSVML